ncbi:MAG: ABC transporter ATP-binding protein [Tepidisphaeraceae bacterium]
MTTVRLDKVSKAFGKFVALHPLDLTIHEGELFFLLGPSGCGKSTLLRLIAGLHEPTSGKIFFDDKDVTDVGTEKRNAAMCFQSYALWPHMSVRDNIRFGLDVRKVPDKEARHRVDEVIGLVQLDKQADKKPNELSGGQQQRVALARALVVRPDCLLLDEPLSNLDAKLRLEMRSEIRRICRASGLTAIYVTHDQKEALSIADRMAVLNHGKIEQVGKPQDLYLRPCNKFVANFMGETNFIEGTIARIDANHAIVATAMGDIRSNTTQTHDGRSLAQGQKVVISLRPETIHLGNEGTGHNVFDADVSDTLYLGEVAQHIVHIGANGNAVGPALRAFELNPHIVARDGEVEHSKAWFDPADVLVLPG